MALYAKQIIDIYTKGDLAYKRMDVRETYYSNTPSGGPTPGRDYHDNRYDYYTLTTDGKEVTSSSVISPIFSYTPTTYYILGSGKLVLPSDSSNLFAGMKNESFNFSNIDTSHVTNMSYMFNGVGQGTGHGEKIKDIDLSSWDMSNVTKTTNMFNNNHSVEVIYIYGGNVRSLTDAESMFFNCPKLERISASAGTNGLESSPIGDSAMFFGCPKLKSYDGSVKGSIANVTSANNTTVKGLFSPYSPKKYDFNFYIDGVLDHTDQVVEGSFATRPADPVKENARFDCGSTSSTTRLAYGFNVAAYKNTDLFAMFIDTKTVDFVSSYGTVPAQQIVDINSFATNPGDLTDEHHVFRGGYDSPGYTNLFDFNATPIIENTVIYAKGLDKHTVYFNMNGHGKQIDPIEVGDEERIEAPTEPTEPWYKFLYWHLDTDPNQFDFNTPITSDIVLVAQWEEVETSGTYVCARPYNEVAGRYEVNNEKYTVWFSNDRTANGGTWEELTPNHGNILMGDGSNTYVDRSKINYVDTIGIVVMPDNCSGLFKNMGLGAYMNRNDGTLSPLATNESAIIHFGSLDFSNTSNLSDLFNNCISIDADQDRVGPSPNYYKNSKSGICFEGLDMGDLRNVKTVDGMFANININNIRCKSGSYSVSDAEPLAVVTLELPNCISAERMFANTTHNLNGLVIKFNDLCASYKFMFNGYTAFQTDTLDLSDWSFLNTTSAANLESMFRNIGVKKLIMGNSINRLVMNCSNLNASNLDYMFANDGGVNKNKTEEIYSKAGTDGSTTSYDGYKMFAGMIMLNNFTSSDLAISRANNSDIKKGYFVVLPPEKIDMAYFRSNHGGKESTVYIKDSEGVGKESEVYM